MPIVAITLDRRRNLADIAREAYAIDKKDDAALARAVAALRQANPVARGSDTLAKGATLVLPAVSGLMAAAPPNAVAPAGPDAPRLALQRAEALQRVARSAHERAMASAKGWERKVASGNEIQAILKSRPDLRDQLDAIREAAAQRVKHIDEAQQTFDALIDEAKEALKKML
jgi:hypothetical protein